MKKIIFVLLCIFCFVRLSSEEKKWMIKQYVLDEDYEQDKIILEKYGNLWAIYSLAETIIINNREEKPIKELSIYYFRNNNYYFMGKYDKNGIYNKDSKLIYKNPFVQNFIGYSDSILEDPFYTGQYAYEKKIGPGAFEPFVKIQINIQDDSIEVKP